MGTKGILWACVRNFSNCKVFVHIPAYSISFDKSIVSINPFLLTLGRNESTSPKQISDNYRHGYHEESEQAINDQICVELNACYSYLEMASYFGRSDVSLPGCYAFFFQMHLEELGHAHKLMRYQNMRGGKVKLAALKPMENCEWNIQSSFEKGLEMEKQVKEKLIEVVNVAEKHKDLSMADFIVAEYVQAQEKSIQEYARLLHRYKGMSGQCACSDYLFDKELHRTFSPGNNEDEIKLTCDEKEYK